jgi:hypothetical protein
MACHNGRQDLQSWALQVWYSGRLMSSDLKNQISLVDFHRHILVTDLKGNSDCVLGQLEKRARRSGESFGSLLEELIASCYQKNPEYLDNNWYRMEVLLDRCYFAHPDFRHRWVPKGQRFVDFLDNQLQEIERGLFPCSYEIRAPWSEPMPEPLVRQREPEKYFILDGQLRVIRHWYHHVPKVNVFIYQGELRI